MMAPPRLNEGETRNEASTLLPEPAIIKLSIQASNVDNHLELPIFPLSDSSESYVLHESLMA